MVQDFHRSPVVGMVLTVLAPTLNFSAGPIGDMPGVPSPEGSPAFEIEGLVQSNTSLSRADWDSFETSWDFKHNPLV